MLVCDRLADASDDFLDLDVAAMGAFHLLDQDHFFLVLFCEHRECSPAVPPQRRMAVIDRVLDVLWIVVDAAHDDEVLDAARDEQLPRFVHEAEIAGAQPRFVFPLDARLERRCGRLRIVPIALADMGSAHPHLADLVGGEPPPALRIDNRDALADEVAAAAHHAMRIIRAGGRSEFMTLKCVAADGAYDRTATPGGSGDQQCRFCHAVEWIGGAWIEAIGTERRGKPLDGVRSHRLGAVDCDFPA